MGDFLLAVARFSFGFSLSLMSLVAMADQKADDLVKQSDESRGPRALLSRLILQDHRGSLIKALQIQVMQPSNVGTVRPGMSLAQQDSRLDSMMLTRWSSIQAINPCLLFPHLGPPVFGASMEAVGHSSGAQSRRSEELVSSSFATPAMS